MVRGPGGAGAEHRLERAEEIVARLRRAAASGAAPAGVAGDHRVLDGLQRSLEAAALAELDATVRAGRRPARSAIGLHRTLLLRGEHLAAIAEAVARTPPAPELEGEPEPVLDAGSFGQAVGEEEPLFAMLLAALEAGRWSAVRILLGSLRRINDEKRRTVLKLLLELPESPVRPLGVPHRGPLQPPRADAAESWTELRRRVDEGAGGVEVDLNEKREARLLQALGRREPEESRPRGGFLGMRGGREALGVPPPSPMPPPSLPGAPAPLTPEEERPAEPPERLVRTPHMELSAEEPLAPGTDFDVEVWADRQAARAGETSEEVHVELPSGERWAALDVRLTVSRHFTITRLPGAPLLIDRDQDDSGRLAFGVRVRDAGDLAALADENADPAEGSIAAHFSFRGRPCGKVARRVRLRPAEGESPARTQETARTGETVPAEETVSPAEPPQPPEPPPPRPPRLVVDARAVRADLLIHVKQPDPADDRRYEVTVTSPLESVTGPWALSGSTRELVDAYMADFTNPRNQPAARRDALYGAGKRLFRAAPEHVRKAFWRLIDAGLEPESIAVVSEEPYVPWELMIPNEQGHTTREPLGVEFPVGRWTTLDSVSAPQLLPLADSFVIAPEYEGPERLPQANDEAEWVRDRFAGERIDPAVYGEIDGRLRGRAVALLHFVCHGDIGARGIGQQLRLEDEQVLSTTQVEGSRGFESALRGGQPLVFLNACKAGHPVPELAGIGGFAPTFIGLGAGAVIAPLWSVRDSIAHRAATDFYDRVLAHPDRPFAEILREIRRRAYEEEPPEDSWAAYCFYGDPLAARAAPG